MKNWERLAEASEFWPKNHGRMGVFQARFSQRKESFLTAVMKFERNLGISVKRT
jgi:hypothetical protein